MIELTQQGDIAVLTLQHGKANALDIGRVHEPLDARPGRHLLHTEPRTGPTQNSWKRHFQNSSCLLPWDPRRRIQPVWSGFFLGGGAH